MSNDPTEEDCCPPQHHLLGDADTDDLTAVFKALADPTRLRIYHHVATSDGACACVCACHMPAVLGISQPTLSHHLKKLVQAGLVSREMRGKWAHYHPCPERLTSLRGLLASLARATEGTSTGL